MNNNSISSQSQTPYFHVLVKPTGARCNLACRYCFYLPKDQLYPDAQFRMPDEILEEYHRQYLQAMAYPEVTVAWQGGEPTLMGLAFFRKAIALQEKYKHPQTKILNTIQTNGVLLNDEWCQFFKEHNFLVGISIDGPQRLHNVYRVDQTGKGTFNKVMQGLRCLQKHQVDLNILATVHAGNADYPLEVYRFFRDEAKAEFIQFIPIVERDNTTGYQEGNTVTKRSVTAEQYGKFLIAIFDEWVKQDVGKIYVQLFDIALAAWSGAPETICVFAPTCGHSLVLEHNGDMYACDHFVEPSYYLGNILDHPMTELATLEKQQKFGIEKLDSLPNYCQDCKVSFVCHGGCPKNRFITTPRGEPGLNYLCRGYRAFFRHIDRPMRLMAKLLEENRAPAEIMQKLPKEQKRKR